ncbi:MAG: helix-turn-helix domain-containing protein [Candidatus Limnocylindrales bacterium]
MPKPPSDWISLSEAAELLASSNVKFTPGTIGRWARLGQLQSIKVGNRRFVRRAQVRSLLRPRGSVHGDELQPGLFEDLDD